MPYAAWTAWAKAAGEPPGTQRLFAAALDARGRSEFARLYKGVRLIKEREKRQPDLTPDVEPAYDGENRG